MRILLHLNNERARQAAIQAIQQANEGWVMSLQEPTRTLPQNAALHAALTDIALQIDWHGQKLDVEDWKRLLTAAWCRATKQQVSLLPAVDGNGFDVLYRRTSKMNKSELSELLEYVFAWGADQGVRFSA